MKTRLLIIILGIAIIGVSTFMFLPSEQQNTCERMGGNWNSDHCMVSKQLFESNKMTCDPGPVLEDGICHTDGMLLVIEPSPEPERLPLDTEGNTFSDFDDVATERLSWITYPTYLPEGMSFLGIQRQEPGLAYALFGDSKTAGIEDTLQNNYQTGIVVIFFVEGIVSEYEDWEETAKNRAQNSPLHFVSTIDNIPILHGNGPENDSVFYRDGRYTINIISGLFDSKELEKILRSMLSENKGILETGLTPEDFGEIIVENFEITLPKNRVDVIEGGEFERIPIVLWSKDNFSEGEMIRFIPNNWRVGVVEDSEDKIDNWLNSDDPTLPSGIDASFFSDGINMYIEVRTYPSMSVPLGEYELRAIWSSHQTKEWDSAPFAIILKSGE